MRSPTRLLMLMLALGCAAASGCNNGSGEIHLNNGGSGVLVTGTGKRTQAELTPLQGQKLLAEIRKDPRKLQKLTLPERRYLAKAGVDVRGQKAEQ